MTNYPADLEVEIVRFNNENGTDLKISRTLKDEVMFVEVETSLSDEKLFEFGVQFGFTDRRKSIEGRTW